MFDFFATLYNKFLSVIQLVFFDIVDFFSELSVGIYDALLTALAVIIESIPFPDFLATNGLQVAIDALPQDVLYFLSQTGFNQAMGVLSLGLGFRMLRKLLTFFQW